MSRKNIDPAALLAPLPPTLITCGTTEKPNIMTAAWAGIVNTRPPKCSVSIRPERYSAELIKASRELVINLTTEDLAFAADFCGVRSGRQVDKFEKCGLHPVASAVVSAPTLDESPLSLECRVTDILPQGSHELYMLDVVSVSVREELFDKNGRMELDKCGLIAYAHGDYFALGKKIGSFGWTVRKKKQTKGAQMRSPSEKQVPKTDRKSTAFPKKTGTKQKKKKPDAPKR